LPLKKTKQVALFSVLVAVCVAIQILPRPLGVEFTSFLTFATGVTFGSLLGASFGIVIMVINGFLSPWGLAGINLPFQMLGMGIIGTAGGLYKMKNGSNMRFFGETAIMGAFLTLIYYVITNMGFAIHLMLFTQFSPLEAIIISQISGALVTLMYVASNTILFGFGVVPLVNAIRKLYGGENNANK